MFFMVYIYKKKRADKIYYYLRASVKKKGKVVTKDIAYLGSSLKDVVKSLSNIPQKYKVEIRKAYKTIHRFLEANYYIDVVKSKKLKRDDYLGNFQEEVEACKEHWDKVFLKQDELTKEEILKNFVVEFSYNTTSLEGNTITLLQAHKLLLEERTPKNKTLREVYDLQNTQRVFLSVFSNTPEITHDSIQHIHKQLLDRVDARIGYRTQDVRVYMSRFDSSPAPYVKADMDALLKWYNEHQNLHPFVLACLFHHKFEKIHPFMDGNGRCGRILLNLILLLRGYPPLYVRKVNREKYLNALSFADKADLNDVSVDKYRKLVEFCSREMIKGYWNVFL